MLTEQREHSPLWLNQRIASWPQPAFSPSHRTCARDNIHLDRFSSLQRSGVPLLLEKTWFVQHTTPKFTEFVRLILGVRGFFCQYLSEVNPISVSSPSGFFC
ncbi:hypothetical protein K443DRAFT_195311 [Laccaria amethystina LaAM-08-1]|uniref:Uncharacterized protein n=1 Tax=Laccaria amethystina LaAM-08-1 TaxID=1095629 RepID=A0A0C9X108_9AGAR|nr:hypothetical protein K443DRAFT_195311 [Laccaria amethystina LaAM-08-1]